MMGATHCRLTAKSPATVQWSHTSWVSPLKILNDDYACSSQCQALMIAIFLKMSHSSLEPVLCVPTCLLVTPRLIGSHTSVCAESFIVHMEVPL